MASELAPHVSVVDVPAIEARSAGEVLPNAPGAGVPPPPPLAAATAVAALTMPAPQSDVVQVLPAGNGVAVDCNIVVTWAGVSDGLTDSISETTPTTCGVAMLVPW